MKTKEFDAVLMKDNCQDQLRTESEGMTEQERRERVEDWLARGDDVLARLWRRIQKPSAPARPPGSEVESN